MRHNIYVRWSAGIILIGNFDLQTQHSHRHKSILHGRRLMDTGAAVLWNNLPNNIRCASPLLLFKSLLKTFLF